MVQWTLEMTDFSLKGHSKIFFWGVGGPDLAFFRFSNSALLVCFIFRMDSPGNAHLNSERITYWFDLLYLQDILDKNPLLLIMQQLF